MSTVADDFESPDISLDDDLVIGESIRVTGIVQGVGFRPTVWRLTKALNLAGDVYNDGHGVVINVWGQSDVINNFIDQLRSNVPPLARIDGLRRTSIAGVSPNEFRISQSESSTVSTNVAPDAAVCKACMEDTLDPLGRRYRFPLTNCTHCGPRFSIVQDIPYDRGNTSMKVFEQCEDCLAEYTSPEDRRFHAQPNACYACGPRVSFERVDNSAVCMESLSQLDEVDSACTVLQNGGIIAIKGIGGFHLACDATNQDAVQNLRSKKQRYGKSFALMARDIDVVRRYAQVTSEEEILLTSMEAPIVLLQKSETAPPGEKRQFGAVEGLRANDLVPISELVAPGTNNLGFMLPYTPMHHLMLKRMNRPIVFTSANLSDEPQIIHNEEIKLRLGELADYVLWHNRDIVNRLDDSVVRIMRNKPRLIRRSRGYAPAPISLAHGFENSPAITGMGGELKNTFCFIKEGHAILSQHMGDLEDARAYNDYKKNMALYARLFQHDPELIVVDAHPEYLSSKLGRQYAKDNSKHCIAVQHHHAHIAACLAENKYPMDAEPVLGVALDGLGYGDDGTIWGGEFIIADYVSSTRVGTFKPVAMLGGTMAIREPWRNTYSHLISDMNWAEIKMNFEDLDLIKFMEEKPLDTFNTMLSLGKNAPLASSCGRLFDAVASAVGICRESILYEGQAAIELEAIVDKETLLNEDEQLAYPFSIPMLNHRLPYIEPLAMWQALLGDLILDTPASVMSARFHKGLAKAIVTMIKKVTNQDGHRQIHTVALTGGVFQNKTLFELVVAQLEHAKFSVLTHQIVPTNDGGIALGQAVIGAASYIKNQKGFEASQTTRSETCV